MTFNAEDDWSLTSVANGSWEARNGRREGGTHTECVTGWSSDGRVSWNTDLIKMRRWKAFVWRELWARPGWSNPRDPVPVTSRGRPGRRLWRLRVGLTEVGEQCRRPRRCRLLSSRRDNEARTRRRDSTGSQVRSARTQQYNIQLYLPNDSNIKRNKQLK